MGWKDRPVDPAKVWKNASLEIQILLACPWSCQACDQFSNFSGISWVKKGTMSLAQIEHFIGEMHAKNAFFGRLRLVGGEPATHPKLAEIVKLLHAELVAKGHVNQIEIVTNGDYNDRLEPLKPFVQKVRVSNEKDKQRNHTANLRATPNSLGYQGKRCGQPEFCGWSLSYYGYAPCSSGAGLMRLHDWIGKHQRLELPDSVAAWPEIQELCNSCYHALRDEDKVRCGTGMQPGQHELNAPSAESWASLAPWLSGKQPDWKVYAA